MSFMFLTENSLLIFFFPMQKLQVMIKKQIRKIIPAKIT